MLAKTLANVLDVPFSVSDATTFTQVSTTMDVMPLALNGYVGWMWVYFAAVQCRRLTCNTISDCQM